MCLALGKPLIQPPTVGQADHEVTHRGLTPEWRCRSNAVTITLFVAPQALLMQVPLIGPLVYVPMQYAAAWLLDLLLSDVPTRPALAAAATHAQVSPSLHACVCCLARQNPTQQWSFPGTGGQIVGIFSRSSRLRSCKETV